MTRVRLLALVQPVCLLLSLLSLPALRAVLTLLTLLSPLCHDLLLSLPAAIPPPLVPQPTPQVVRRERHFTQFTRSFTLPDNIKEDAITASLDKGVLTIMVPKVEPAPKPQPKRIAVKGAVAAVEDAKVNGK